MKEPSRSMVTQVLDAIVKPMEESEKRRHERTLVDLNHRNRALIPGAHDGFLYGGVFHFPKDGAVLPPKGRRNGLHPSLWDEAEARLADVKATADDLRFIRQILFKLLTPCESWQDARDALPEFLADAVQETKALPRTRPEAYTLRDDERSLRQLGTLEEKIAVYRVGRLMY